MIANYVNEQHDTWDQFLRGFVYAIRTAVDEMTGKTSAELFLSRKLITPFQKLVMVSDGTEFAVGDIERLFEEVRQNRKAKHEKWEKYYNRRRKCDEMEIRTGSSDSNSSRQESSSFNRVQRRSGESQYGRKKGSDGINDHVNLHQEDQKGRFGKVQIIECLKEHCRRTIQLAAICKNLERRAEEKKP
ncbi:UNVERIFIED_CONTAM: hypothetical protein NCL1_55924 [Trichonephila clavipes]